VALDLAAVRFLVEAQEELWATHEWYRLRSPTAARRFAHEIRRAVALIAASPHTWPVLRRNTRRYVLKRFPFSIVYRVEDSRVCVVAVAHAKRRYGYWRDRE
jgi:plasmid stabilization system protein ParE